MLHSPEILEVNTNSTASSNGSKRVDSNNNNNSSANNKNNKSKQDQHKTGAGEFFSFRKNSDSVKFQL